MKHRKYPKYILIFVMIICLCACGEIEFSEKGKVAVEKVEELQNYMKAPDTFVLKDDVLVIEQDNENTNQSNIFVYISYTAENSYGVPLQDIGVFRNDEYMGSYYTIKDNIITPADLGKMGVEPAESIYAIAQLAKEEQVLELYSKWEKGDLEEFEIISCKDIGKELSIKYK